MSIRKPQVIFIAGPTAVGKSSVSIAMAQAFGCDILNADSRQLYKELSIGTAKPKAKDLSKVKHHFINSHSILDPFTASDYVSEGLNILEEIWKSHDVAIISGGTGLYIQGILEGFDDVPDVDDSIINGLKDTFELSGLPLLQEELKDRDPDYYLSVDLENPHRLIRALSVIRMTGQPFSSFLKKKVVERNFDAIKLLLNIDRESLYAKINKRVDLMIDQGLVAEVAQLIEYRALPALNTVGYKELFDYIDGLISLDEAIELIKRNSRRYAKRQMTWYRNRSGWKTFHPDDMDKMLKYVRKSRP